MQPTSLNELLECAADALNDRDTDRLEELQMVIEGWIQSNDDASAQRAMLEAMLEAAYCLKDKE